MTPVFQTKHGVGGNCWQAAVASILDLDLDDVPDFVNRPDPQGEYEEFLREKGFIAVKARSTVQPDCYYLAFGPSIVTGRKHAVVMRKGELAHDPHEGRNGLSSIEYINLIVPIEIDLS